MKNDSKHKGKIILSTSRGMESFHYDEILYCEADGNYTRFHLAGKETTLLICQTLKKTEQQLDSDDFFRTDKSFLVNLLHLKLYKRDVSIIILDNDEQVPVSRRNKKIFFKVWKETE